jgi:adenine phosphoribosyltransferase
MFCDVISKYNPNAIVALESRGFILGGAIAFKLNLPMVPIRKPNKLPGPVKSIGYSLHYGNVC